MAASGESLVEQLMRFKPEHFSANQWAIAAGVARSVWTDLRHHGNPSRRTLEKLLGVAGSSLAEFEALLVLPASAATDSGDEFSDAHWGWRGAPLLPLPLFKAAAADVWGEQKLDLWRIDRSRAVAHLPRPPSLASDNDAYAIEVPSSAMAPRLRPGRQIAISPSAGLRPEDDVLVVLANDSSNIFALAGRFVRGEGEGIVIRQYRGERQAIVTAEEIASLEVIVGELI